VVIPEFVATVAILPGRATSSLRVRITAHWAPRVTLYLTTIRRNETRRHYTITTDGHGVASITFAEVRPAAHKTSTLTVRVWGVYVHHRKTLVLHTKLMG
jgi:hypothetical protein